MNTPTQPSENVPTDTFIATSAQTTKSRLSYNLVSMSSGLILFFDILCVLLAASLSNLLYSYWQTPLNLAADFATAWEQAALVAAVLAPFILFDPRFGAAATCGHMGALIRSYALRFTLFTSVIVALGAACQALEHFPQGWLVSWFAVTVFLTSLTRALLAQSLRHLQRQGVLTEVIAVVGAGPVADRLVHSLRQSHAGTIELLGVFDDKILGAAQSEIKSVGTVDQLIELGKTRKIDWIVLTLPPTAEQRVLSIVRRLKALSVPIGLCPQHVGLTVPYNTVDYVGDGVPVSLLAGRPVERADALIKAAEDLLPRWMITLALLPLAILETLTARLTRSERSIPQPRAAKLTFQFDNYDLAAFAKVAAGYGQNRYGYVVTPNADHMIRLHEDAAFRSLYAAANYVLLDSRFLARILRFTKGIELPVCTGSDLTEKLFSEVIAPNDSLVLIGGTDEQARQLRARYGVERLAHFNPPMGFISDPKAVEACLNFIESHSPFRFCMLAIGSPQQEVIAQKLKARGIARGLTLCIGASINFLTGDERRAPVWMQQCGMEWFYRLMQAPGRMAKRYLVRGPRVFGLLQNAEIVLRKAPSTPVLRLVPTSTPPVATDTATTTHAEPARLRLAALANQPAGLAAQPSELVTHLDGDKPDRAVNAS